MNRALRRLEAQVEHTLIIAFNTLKDFLKRLLGTFLKEMRANPREFVWLYDHSRLPALKQHVTQAINSFISLVDTTVLHARQAAAQLGSQAASVLPLPPFVPGLGTLIAQKIASILMLAVDGIHMTVDTSIETLINEPRWRALTLARTEMYNAYREALLQGYAAMPDIIGWIWQTAEDERVCPFCTSMDGTEHPIGEPMITHPNCRCEIEPLAGGVG